MGRRMGRVSLRVRPGRMVKAEVRENLPLGSSKQWIITFKEILKLMIWEEERGEGEG